MMNVEPRFLNAKIILLLGIVIAVAVYWSGLAGSFVFDDSVFLIGNQAIRVSSLALADWVNAAMSFPSGSHQGRWLGMLSFAANYYFTGLDPYWLKLTNLAIHLLNGVMLFLALRALFRFHHACREGKAEWIEFDPGMAAAALACLWLVLPINLTGVLYISQRLESLSNTFVFLGLWWYLRARLALWHGRAGASGLWIALLVGTGVGVLVKESAILLPLFAFSVELALTGFRERSGRWSKPVLTLYGSLLLIPLTVGLIWLAGWVGGPRSYGRAFDIPQRLMTEGRVLIDYIVWTLAPSLDALTLYHDDIAVSKGLLDPPATLAALAAISGLIGIALWKRERYPLFALGIFWFFGGHVLTATVIPLMLAFEHRNYFPSVGLLLATASLFALESRLLRRRLLVVATLCLFSFYAFTTALRSIEWASPLTLSASDAAKRPNSSAAQYEYARILLASTVNGDSEPSRKKAFVILENMAANPEADAVHNQLLITTSAKLKLPINDIWWYSMIEKLRARPVSSVDVSALSGLMACLETKVCPRDIENYRNAFEAATGHPGGYSQLLSTYGKFALVYLGDFSLAEKQFRAAVRQSPTDPEAQANLVGFFVSTGGYGTAKEELKRLRSMNHLGRLDKKVDELDRRLKAASGEKHTQPDNPLPRGPVAGPRAIQ
ncbi:hypothetical protein [Dokdonella sp.]|uniref:hypothetical protein n=1 Tax=Dokdonella sp. TaxID=2291710 RepID=UPI002CD27536|nr:hypothetical protein [Dokdonella sp.]HOX72164.1 hypothetical protein [Dokdonella sp.]HPN80723.1 hypothetical protein [Dokdonella sp.]